MIKELKDKDFLNVTELSELMGMSKSYVYDYIKSEACPFTVIKLGKRMIVPVNDYLRWYDSLQRKVNEQEVSSNGND